MAATLIPRKFRIEQDVNEYVYFVEWIIADHGIGWAVRTARQYLTHADRFDYMGTDTLLFATPEDALQAWKKYIEVRKPAFYARITYDNMILDGFPP